MKDQPDTRTVQPSTDREPIKARYRVTIPVVIDVDANSEHDAIRRASFTIGHGVHYVYGGEWITRLDDQATVTS